MGKSIIHNSRNWHRNEQDEVDKNENLPAQAEYNRRRISSRDSSDQ